MKNQLYYHVYLTDDYGAWSSIILEQFKLMQDHNLLDIFDDINFTVVTPDDQRRIFAFTGLVESIRPKCNYDFVKSPYSTDDEMVANINSEKTVTENETMKKIWNNCKNSEENIKLLYLHSKGVTSYSNLLKNNNPEKFRNYFYWRNYLNWGVIENWRKCYAQLDICDTAGINYRNQPTPHYSGGFWWANSNYIKRLPDPATKTWWYDLKSKSHDNWLKNAPDRFRDEQWLLCLESHNAYNVHDLPDNMNPAGRYLPRLEYESTNSIFHHPV